MTIKEISIEEFFETTFSEEFLQEADDEYTMAQIAGRSYDTKITTDKNEGKNEQKIH